MLFSAITKESFSRCPTPFWLPGAFCSEGPEAIAGPILPSDTRCAKSLKNKRYTSINDEGSRQFLPGAFRHGKLLPGTICAPSRKEAPDSF
jgi:hypothetical protein